MSKTVTIHFGLPKCGSTAIQTVCAGSREALLKHGIFYPEIPRPRRPKPPAGHIALGGLLTQETDAGSRADPVLQKLIGDFEKAGARHLFLSSASFIMRARRFKASQAPELLKPYRVRGVLFMRRRDEWLKSRYKHHVLMKFATTSFSERLPFLVPEDFSIVSAIQNVQAAFGLDELHIIDLDQGGGDAVESIGELLEFDIKGLTESSRYRSVKYEIAVESGGRINTSLPDDMALALLECNRAGMGEALREEFFHGMYRASFGRPESRIELLSADLSRRILEEGAAERRELAGRFAAGLAEPAPVAERADKRYKQRLSRDEFDGIVREAEPSMSDEACAELRRVSGVIAG